MSEYDIRVFYRQAKDREKEIKILAQLNGCPEDTIEKIIEPEKSNKNKRSKSYESHKRNRNQGKRLC